MNIAAATETGKKSGTPDCSAIRHKKQIHLRNESMHGEAECRHASSPIARMLREMTDTARDGLTIRSPRSRIARFRPG
jgi:hypothetical protein